MFKMFKKYVGKTKSKYCGITRHHKLGNDHIKSKNSKHNTLNTYIRVKD